MHAQETTHASQFPAIIARAWEWMSNHQVALPIEDYKRARRSLDPAGVDITLDSTVQQLQLLRSPNLHDCQHMVVIQCSTKCCLRSEPVPRRLLCVCNGGLGVG